MEVFQRSTLSRRPLQRSDGQLIMDRNEPIMVTELIVDPPDLLHRVEEKWQFRLRDTTVLLDIMSTYCNHEWLCTHLTPSIEETKAVFKHHPEPQIQRRNLLDLPPELLHQVMAAAYADDAMRLGSTCKLLREISLQYIYQVCIDFTLIDKEGDSKNFADTPATAAILTKIGENRG